MSISQSGIRGRKAEDQRAAHDRRDAAIRREIETERARSLVKTARLRALRLEREAEWHALTKVERIALCRRLAEEAQKDRWAGSELAPSWADLASQWRMLASEIERSH